MVQQYVHLSPTHKSAAVERIASEEFHAAIRRWSPPPPHRGVAGAL
jgi:hypothetical protein